MDLNEELINRDYSKLPRKYWASQNLCWYLHDVMMSIFREVIDEDLIETKIKFKNNEEANELESYDCIYDWLKEKKRDDEFSKILCKDLSMRLIGDFLNYIYEVLSNLERGKITIACDLLRKPFKDNLFYLEWILYNDKEISNYIYDGKIDEYALENVKYAYKRKIVLSSLKKNNFINQFEDIELNKTIFDIRYNYNNSASLQLVWNKATHLVTTFNKIKTKDFNFIYNNSIDYDNYWEYLYGKIPLLLLYSVGVVENIFNKYFKTISDGVRKYNLLLITGKFFASNDKTRKEGEILINLVDGYLNLPCENCKKIVKLRKPESYLFYNYWNVICPECNEEINVCKYFFL